MREKQKNFCENYMANGGNATQAAIGAGYSHKSARSIASENLTKPNIKKYISEQYENIVGSPELNVDMVLGEIQSLYVLAKQEGKYSDALRACKLKLDILDNMKLFIEEHPEVSRGSLFDELDINQKRRLLALLKYQHLDDDTDLIALDNEARHIISCNSSS